MLSGKKCVSPAMQIEYGLLCNVPSAIMKRGVGVRVGVDVPTGVGVSVRVGAKPLLRQTSAPVGWTAEETLVT